MSALHRLLIGAAGGVTPVFLNMALVDATTVLSNMTRITLAAYVIRVIGLLATGAVWAWMQENCQTARQVFQIGMVAPAMVTLAISGNAARVEAVHHAGAQTTWLSMPVVHAAQAAQTVRPYAEDVPSQIWRGLLGIYHEPADLLVIVAEAQTEAQARATLASLRRAYPLPFSLFLPSPRLCCPYWMVTLGGQLTYADSQRALADAQRWRLPVTVRTIPR